MGQLPAECTTDLPGLQTGMAVQRIINAIVGSAEFGKEKMKSNV